jgi:hypothetical protein
MAAVTGAGRAAAPCDRLHGDDDARHRASRCSTAGRSARPVQLVRDAALFLTAMGLGLGGYVDQNPDPSLAGLTYLQFLAPGLLAATVMQTGSFEAAFPILGGLQWNKIFHAMFATPIRALDIALGNIAWIGFRLTLVASIFAVVVVALGASRSPLIVLAIPAAVLTGLSFHRRSWRSPRRSERRTASRDLPVRDHAAVPVQRHVLPDREPAVVPPAGRLDLAAVARRGPVPVADARHHRARPAARRHSRRGARRHHGPGHDGRGTHDRSPPGEGLNA